ncbi:MAG: Dabb family protein, partial [Chloroflexota bacterium]
FKFRPGLTDEQMAGFVQALAALPRQIPQAKNWHAGRNLSSSDQAFDFGYVCDFDNWHTFAEYTNHPAHADFLLRYVTPHVANRAMVDIEF